MKTLISTSDNGAATMFVQRARTTALSLLAMGLIAVPATAYSAIIGFEGAGDNVLLRDDFLLSDGVQFTGATYSFEVFTGLPDDPNTPEDESGGSGMFATAPSGGDTAMVVIDPEANEDNGPTSVVATLNFASGFTSVSFLYAALVIGDVQFFDDINGNGNPIGTPASLIVGLQDGCEVFQFACNWTTYSQSFSGSIARSMVFSGASGFVVVDNIELAPVPLPAAAWLLLSGLAGLGFFGRRRATAN